MKDLKGKIALVTGAGSGIGRAIALKLAKMGMNIVLCGRREEKLWAVSEETRRPEDMVVIAGDLTADGVLDMTSYGDGDSDNDKPTYTPLNNE